VFLTEKSFDSLESGGRIAIHEIVYNDDKTGPVAAASMDVLMLLWVQGQQLSGAEFSQMLETAGFTDVKVTPTFGYWSVVTGRKP
jgi:ubiquinone/menaquinone biosynthesis C-methylase UbiE